MSRSVALIGAGRWGKNLARNFDQLDALHTICDMNESLLDQLQQKHPKVYVTTNYREVLDNQEVKRVVIASPAIQHYEMAKQALEAGKDVYVEKPICVNSGEGEELIELADRKGSILMVGHLLQYHPCVHRLQELVGSGELGKIQYIVSNRLNLGHIRTEENALWNFAPHDVSVILSLCGNQLPNQVRCTGGAYMSRGVADTTLTNLRFDNDVRAHIFVSWLHPFKEQKLIVVGSAGLAVFDDTKGWDEKLVLYRNHVKWSEGNVPLIDNDQAEKVLVQEAEPLREECAHFLHCCEERLTPRTDGQEGLRVQKVLLAAQASLNVDGEAMDPHQNIDLGFSTAVDYQAHPTAVIDPNAEIGMGSKIWHFTHVMSGAKIGQKCNLGQNVVVSSGVVLGENCKVQNNVSLYKGVVCEDNVFLGPGMVFTNVMNPRSEISRKNEYRQTLVRKGATVGANATVICGIELGAYCFIGAGAVVTKSVKPYALVLGNPGKQVGWMSRNGEKLDLPVELSTGEEMTAVCPATGEKYVLEGDVLSPLSEERELVRV